DRGGVRTAAAAGGRAAGGLALHPGVDVQVLAGVHDLHRLEAGRPQGPLVIVHRQGAGDAADVRLDAPDQGVRQWFFQGDVADGDPAAGPEDAVDLPEDGRLVGGQVDD